MILKKDRVDGRARVTMDEERVTGLNRVVEILRLDGCEKQKGVYI